MALNEVILQGRIPFDLELTTNEDKKSFLRFTVSVQRNYKPEGEKYYPEDLIVCKAYNEKAKFIADYFPKGSFIIVRGDLRRDNDYEKDGQLYKGQLFVNVNDVYFEPKNNGNDTESSSGKSASKSTATPKRANPFSGGSAKKSPFST